MFNKPSTEIEEAQLAFVRAIHDDWALVTAGTEDAWNTMTIGWGEAGTLWSTPTITVYVHPRRYTHRFLLENDYFTVQLSLLDRASGMLFPGDPIQRDGRIYMFGPMRSLAAYICGLRRLQERIGEIRSIWPCHATCPIEPDTISELIAGAEAVERGEAAFAMDEVHGIAVRAYEAGPSVLLCDEDWVGH